MMRRLLRTREFLRDEASRIRKIHSSANERGRDSTQVWITCPYECSYAHSWLTSRAKRRDFGDQHRLSAGLDIDS